MSAGEGTDRAPLHGENFEELPPFFAEIGTEVQQHIMNRVKGWQQEGKQIDLGGAVLILQLTGAAMEGRRGAMSASFKGTVEQEMPTEEVMRLLVKAIQNNARVFGYHDPITKGLAYEAAIDNFVEQLREVTGETERRSRSFIGRMRNKFPSRARERRLVSATNGFLRLVTHIQEEGSVPEPPEEKTAPMSGLSREDFEAGE